jgi:arylsulfatase A-like enzyme
VLISFDTTRADHLSVYGYERPTTPNLERLAADGVVFTQAISTSTYTTPSHASLLTGVRPQKHGVTNLSRQLRPGIPTWAGILKENGYTTGGFVSAIVIGWRASLERGFDTYDWSQYELRRDDTMMTWESARRWLAEIHEPWFLFIHSFEPHTRYIRNDFGNDPVSRYDSEIANVDKVMGEMLDAFPKNTLVIMTADHGEVLNDRPNTKPYTHGARAYDEVVNIPLVMKFPDGLAAGSRIYPQVHHLDVLPTVLDYLNIETDVELEGRSLLPLLNGEELPPKPAFIHGISKSTFTNDIPGIAHHGRLLAVRHLGWKLVEYPLMEGGVYQELFHLREDPGELENVADLHPEKVAELHALLDEWNGTHRGYEAPDQDTPYVINHLRELGYIE